MFSKEIDISFLLADSERGKQRLADNVRLSISFSDYSVPSRFLDYGIRLPFKGEVMIGNEVKVPVYGFIKSGKGSWFLSFASFIPVTHSERGEVFEKVFGVSEGSRLAFEISSEKSLGMSVIRELLDHYAKVRRILYEAFEKVVKEELRKEEDLIFNVMEIVDKETGLKMVKVLPENEEFWARVKERILEEVSLSGYVEDVDDKGRWKGLDDFTLRSFWNEMLGDVLSSYVEHVLSDDVMRVDVLLHSKGIHTVEDKNEIVNTYKMTKRDLYRVVEAYLRSKRRVMERILENWKREEKVISEWKEVFCDRRDENRKKKSLRIVSSLSSL